MNKKGITLIALIITIIVLLILAGISIALILGDNGIVNKALKAKNVTEEGQKDEEIKLAVAGSYGDNGDLDIGILLNELNKIENIIIIPTVEDGVNTFPVTVESYYKIYEISSNGKLNDIIIPDRTGIKIGDYVNYEPDVTSSTVYSHSTLDTYSGSSKNTDDIVQNSLRWKVLRIYNDGSIDLIGSNTTQGVYFSGILGYSNGVYLMNDICKTLYSRNEDGIIARSVNIEDYDYWLNKSTNGVSIRNSFNNGYVTYGNSKSYTGGYYNRFPSLYKSQTSESEIGTLTTSTTYRQDGTLTVQQTAYSASINENNFSEGYVPLYIDGTTVFWIASRCLNCDKYEAEFRFVGR